MTVSIPDEGCTIRILQADQIGAVMTNTFRSQSLPQPLGWRVDVLVTPGTLTGVTTAVVPQAAGLATTGRKLIA